MSASRRKAPDADQADVEALFRRVIQLSQRGQLELFELLAERLADTSELPTAQADAIERKRGALDAMQQVAQSLNLPAGQAPTTTQFDAQAKALGLDWTVSSVGRAFSKRAGWRLATQTFAGGHLPETARQIRQRRHLANRRSERIDHLASIRQWLDSDPPDESTNSYMLWREKRNQELADTEEPLAVARRHFQRAFPELTWDDLLGAARGDVQDVTELSRARAEERLRTEPNPLRLVGVSTAAALLGATGTIVEWRVAQDPQSFPAVVVVLGNRRGFLEDDVRAHAAGGQFPQRAVGELNALIYGAEDLAELLGRGSARSINLAVVSKRWHLVPEPDGRFAHMNYWLREQVAAWLAAGGPKPRRRSR